MTRFAGFVLIAGCVLLATPAGAQYRTFDSPNLERFDSGLAMQNDLDLLRQMGRRAKTTNPTHAPRTPDARLRARSNFAIGVRTVPPSLATPLRPRKPSTIATPGHRHPAVVTKPRLPKPIVVQRPRPTDPTRKPGSTAGRDPRPTGPKDPGAGRRPGPSIIVRLPGPSVHVPPRWTPVPAYRPPAGGGQVAALPPAPVPQPKAAPQRPAVVPIVAAGRYRPREVLVALPGEATTDFIADLSRTYDIEPRDSLNVSLLGVRLYRFTIRGARTVPQVVAEIQADPRVGDVQPNYVAELQGEASGGASIQYALASLSIPDALTRATGRNVTVAVIDTGVDMGHPELRGVVAGSYDAVRDDTPAAAPHGTAIAGIIGAHGTLRGVAPDARLLAVRAFSTSEGRGTGETDSLTLARAMDWAASRGAAIFNMSFAGPDDPLLERLLDAAHDKGIVLVAAAGNGGPQAGAVWPAAHRDVIAVTAVDHTDRIYVKANRGDYIAVAAPGVDILTAGLNGSYGVTSGTSMAAAHVSGVIALALEASPGMDSDTVRELLASTAHDLGPAGRDDEFGAGKVNALDALLTITGPETTRVARDGASGRSAPR